MSKDELDNIKESYYSIFLAFEVTRDVLNDVDDDNVVAARDILYSKLNSYIPEQEYDVFSSRVVIYQDGSDYNYIIVYSSFIRGSERLPMEGYVDAREIKELIKNEFLEFFNSISLEYKLINVKSLNQ
jgi:dimeric dUTPase (all-alpha-NTP-PPase superfamily)